MLQLSDLIVPLFLLTLLSTTVNPLSFGIGRRDIVKSTFGACMLFPQISSAASSQKLASRPWSYRVQNTQPPTLEPFNENSLASSYAQLTPFYKALPKSEGVVVGLGGGKWEDVLGGIVETLKGRNVVIDSLGLEGEVVERLMKKYPTASLLTSLKPDPSKNYDSLVSTSITSTDGSYIYTPFKPSPQDFNDCYLNSVLSRFYVDKFGVNVEEENWRKFLRERMEYVDTVKPIVNGATVFVSSMENVIFGNTESSTSPYSYTASRIIINPTGSNTLSQNDRVRLAVGTQPRYIKKNEEWGGKKVADFIVFGENPRMKVLGTTKINFAQGF